VQVDAFQIKNYASRERLVGGFYGYSYLTETKKVAAEVTCTGSAGAVTNDKGLATCHVRVPVTGEMAIQVHFDDAQGRRSYAVATVHVRGSDNGNFPVENADRMDLIPTKKLYEPGETATVQVRMPFTAATALVTVERDSLLPNGGCGKGTCFASIQKLSKKIRLSLFQSVRVFT